MNAQCQIRISYGVHLVLTRWEYSRDAELDYLSRLPVIQSVLMGMATILGLSFALNVLFGV